MSPDQESNQQPFGPQVSAQSTEPHQPRPGHSKKHAENMTVAGISKDRLKRNLWETEKTGSYTEEMVVGLK